MGSLGEIALPAGTELVDLREVPRLLSWALFPDEDEGSWRILHGLKKVSLNPIEACPDCIPESLDLNDWTILDAIWESPPPFREPMYDIDWKQYEDVFNNSPNKPSWLVVPCWDDTAMDCRRLRKQSEISHHLRLIDSIKSGNVELANGASAPRFAQQWQHLQLTVIAFADYASRCGLSVRVISPISAKGAPHSPIEDSTATSKSMQRTAAPRQSLEPSTDRNRPIERHTIIEAAIELARNTDSQIDRWLDHIVVSVKSADLPLCNPRDRNDHLPYRIPQIVRSWYDEVTTTDLNAWLESHPEWGITYRFATALTPVRAAAQTRISVSRQQEIAILKEIRELGLDPKAFPKNPSGKRGRKSDVRDAIFKNTSHLFGSSKTFGSTWERLRTSREIVDAPAASESP